MKEHKALGAAIVACICFAAAGASLLAGMIRYHGWGSFPALAAVFLIIAGLLCPSTLLLSAGALIRAVLSLYAAMETLLLFFNNMPHPALLLRTLLTLCASVLLLSLCFSGRRSVLLGWLSGGFMMLSALVNFSGWRVPALNWQPQTADLVSILLNIAAILGPILAGYARREMTEFRSAWRNLFRK